MARANSEHAERLVKALSDAPLDTRALRQWFDHYQKAGRLARERLVEHPHLFLAALEESNEQGMSERLRDGPEGRCEMELRRINILIRSVRKRLPSLCPLSADLTATFSLVQTNFEALGQDIKRYAEHDPHGDPRQRACSRRKVIACARSAVCSSSRVTEYAASCAHPMARALPRRLATRRRCPDSRTRSSVHAAMSCASSNCSPRRMIFIYPTAR